MTTAPLILTIDDLQILVSIYKYLGIWLDEKLAFDVHIDYLVKRLKPRLGFLFRQKRSFSFGARKRIIQSTFLPVLDYGDVIYMHASTYLLKRLDGVYHVFYNKRLLTYSSLSAVQLCSLVLFMSKKKITYVTIYCKDIVGYALLVFYAYVERTIAPDHQMGFN